VTSDRKQLSGDQLEIMVRQLQVELAQERERSESNEYAQRKAENEVKRLRQERIAQGDSGASNKENALLQMRIVEEQARHSKAAEARDKLTLELERLQKEFEQGSVKQTAQVEAERRKLHKLTQEQSQNVQIIMQVREENAQMKEQIRSLQQDLAQNLNAQQQVEVEVKRTVSNLMSTESDLERARRRSEKAKMMQQMLAGLKEQVVESSSHASL